MPRWREGDWYCEDCREQQFARNAVCRQCGTPKPHDLLARQAQEVAALRPRREEIEERQAGILAALRRRAQEDARCGVQTGPNTTCRFRGDRFHCKECDLPLCVEHLRQCPSCFSPWCPSHDPGAHHVAEPAVPCNWRRRVGWVFCPTCMEEWRIPRRLNPLWGWRA